VAPGAAAVSLSPADRDSPAALQQAAVASLSGEDLALGAALSQTGPWSITGSVVAAEVENAFLVNRLSVETDRISGCLSRLAGKPLRFQVNKVTVQETAEEGEKKFPPQVEILRQEFKGLVAEE
jgi:hypothetical protein